MTLFNEISNWHHDGKILLAATRQGMFRSEDSERKVWETTAMFLESILRPEINLYVF